MRETDPALRVADDRPGLVGGDAGGPEANRDRSGHDAGAVVSITVTVPLAALVTSRSAPARKRDGAGRFPFQ